MESLLKELATEDQDELANLLNYCQFLLDDEEMLTPQGNLNVEGRELLHKRMDEAFQE